MGTKCDLFFFFLVTLLNYSPLERASLIWKRENGGNRKRCFFVSSKRAKGAKTETSAVIRTVI